MDDCSQSFRLLPISNSTHFQSFTDTNFRELQLLGRPRSVEEVFGLFQAWWERKVVWIGDEDCAFVRDWKTKRPEGFSFEFKWSVKKDHPFRELLICGTTLQGAIRCLNFLLELSMDASFSVSMLSWPLIGPNEDQERICPFPSDVLEKYIAQNHQGRCGFEGMTFTPLQCKTLATSGKKTHLVFNNCRFQDRGSAFMDAHLSLGHQEESGPCKLDFHTCIPFDSTHIASLLELQELTLHGIELSSELSRTVLSAELQCLRLSCTQLKDEAQQILINNIQQGRGPKGLCLHPYVFGGRGKFIQFCHALSNSNGHGYIKTLKFSLIHINNESLNIESRVPHRQAEHAVLAAF